MLWIQQNRKRLLIGFAGLLVLWFWFSIPSQLFNDPLSTVLLDRNGNLLGAKIADDGQWRFPYNDKVPEKFEKAIIQFEDRSFYRHLGVNPFSLWRAFRQNLSSGKVKSGGSTLSMQVIRLSRKNKPRTIFEKCIEIILATRLELTYSKKEILALYASNAPFGGNVVGLEAASWRYYGRSADKLSWAEISTMAVLPNSPALIYPGKNHNSLKKKRNRLLNRLAVVKLLEPMACSLAKQEPIPDKPFPLPQMAPHLLDRSIKEGFKGKQFRSTIIQNIQNQVAGVIERHRQLLAAKMVSNAAAIVLDVKTGEVLAYVGNTVNSANNDVGGDVDIITAPRSTGSILKPYLYASMLNEGSILPTMLIPDIPTEILGYAPKNFDLTYSGAVPARRALARSLNIPAVRLLHQYGVGRFHYMLRKMGMTTIGKPANHYGLTLILGGAEGCLWDLSGMYASMARTLTRYTENDGKYFTDNFHPPIYSLQEKGTKKQTETESSILSASSIWLTFQAMVEVARPDEELEWQQFSSSSKIAWKTGTSFGNRDAWAIGCTPQYVVAVWVGNADGEGRPGLTGISDAAPVLFDIFKLLKTKGWFPQPYKDMTLVPLCKSSGFRKTTICESTEDVWIQKSGLKSPPCPYHQIVHLDKTGQFRVTSECESIDQMQHISWFVLPPTMEYFFKTNNPFYKVLPPYRDDCAKYLASAKTMEIIYPKEQSSIYVPIEINGEMGKTVFKVAHRNPESTIYWHLDDRYIGSTKSIHQLGFSPTPGTHVLTVVDETGESVCRKFTVIGK